MGYWVHNTSASSFVVTLIPNGSASSSANIQLTYGATATDTLNTLFPSGAVAFEYVPSENRYSKIDFGSGTITMTEYDFNGSSFNQGNVDTLTLSSNSDTNVSFSLPNGQAGDMLLNSVREVTQVNGGDVSGIKSAALTINFTQAPTTIDWQTATWTPRDNNTTITDITTLKNQYLTNNWYNGDNPKFMFKDSGDTTLTSGTLVEATVAGTQSNCTPTAEYDCKTYARTTNVIGKWDLNTTSGVLTFDASSSIYYLRFNGGTLEEAWAEKPGSSMDVEWITGGTDTSNAAAIESTIRGSFSN